MNKTRQKELTRWLKQQSVISQRWLNISRLLGFIFARAALELGLSPSYISKRIAILEKCLNARLFFRNNRVMRLTP
ncbi:LysR family transcriptional regulator, partial [Salmonella enterica subsp. enterica serovar Anatum]|nr:LysR family transcriptional regulator [Salmonella enterica subsp. enterica serovar Anatum]